MNKEVLTTLGLVLAVGFAKDFSGSFSVSDFEAILRQHFAIKKGKRYRKLILLMNWKDIQFCP